MDSKGEGPNMRIQVQAKTTRDLPQGWHTKSTINPRPQK